MHAFFRFIIENDQVSIIFKLCLMFLFVKAVTFHRFRTVDISGNAMIPFHRLFTFALNGTSKSANGYSVLFLILLHAALIE